jgi:hypothetical protein
MNPEQKGKLKGLTGLFAEHNGKDCTVTSTKGKSGETTLVHFDGSKGLFITPDQFEAK